MLNVRLSLHEKLRDLRDERKLKLAQVSQETGIPLSTLQRMESDDETRVGYQDVATLAKFYQVSTDYLFGLTDNRLHRNVEIDALTLSDKAIQVLKASNFNHRLVSEMLAHQDFPSLMQAIEVYIDKKVLPQMNTMNAMFKLAESTIRENFDISANDEIIGFLQQSVVDEDEYLRYRISERFNLLIKNMFEAHKKDALPDEQADVIKDMKECAECYLAEKGNPARAKLIVLAKQIGLNLSELTDEETVVLMKALRRSEKVKRIKKRKR